MDDLESLEGKLGHRFAQRELLRRALTHSSRARELDERGSDNEVLEFLGDAVLGMLAAEELCRRFPGISEGELSKLRAHLVCQSNLVKVSQELHLGRHLRLGRGEERTGGRRKAAILADAVEAVVAALYLDAGIETAREFVLRAILREELLRLPDDPGQIMLKIEDFKSRLQELLQGHGASGPVYEVLAQEGPDHRKTFTMEVVTPAFGQTPSVTAKGVGPNKKAAEQQAAGLALQRLRELMQSGDDHDA